jgi:hypothetical protein
MFRLCDDHLYLNLNDTNYMFGIYNKKKIYN